MLNYKLPIGKFVIQYQYFENRITRNAGYLITLSQNSSGYTVECKGGKIGNFSHEFLRYKTRSYDKAVKRFKWKSDERIGGGYKLIEQKPRRKIFAKAKKQKRNVTDSKLVNYYPQPINKEDKLQKTFENKYREGAEKILIQTTWERNSRLRKDAKIEYGVNCMVCDFTFDKYYGKKIGGSYIEIHHTKSLAEAKKMRGTRIKDVIVICSNCHRIIHRKKGNPLDWEFLKKVIKKRRCC